MDPKNCASYENEERTWENAKKKTRKKMMEHNKLRRG